MKRISCCVVAALAAVTLSTGAIAGKPPEGHKGNGAPKGKFEKFLLVAPGNPNVTSEDFLPNDGSNGRAVFIPVKTTNGPDLIECATFEGDSVIIGDEANTNLRTVEPNKGVKLYFEKDPDATGLDIVDRDATDGYAQINVPQDWENATTIDLWVRVLGKPGGCFQTDAYTFDGSYYFWAGSAAFKRKAGQSTFVDASELTDVYYCPDGYEVVPTGGNNYDCYDLTSDTSINAEEINVFASVFQDYFWDMTNDGVRVVQVLMQANFD